MWVFKTSEHTYYNPLRDGLVAESKETALPNQLTKEDLIQVTYRAVRNKRNLLTLTNKRKEKKNYRIDPDLPQRKQGLETRYYVPTDGSLIQYNPNVHGLLTKDEVIECSLEEKNSYYAKNNYLIKKIKEDSGMKIESNASEKSSSPFNIFQPNTSRGLDILRQVIEKEFIGKAP